jgi:hypothetical protein
MRRLALESFAVLMLAATGASAQDVIDQRPRLSVTISAGSSVTSPLFKHATGQAWQGDTVLRYRELGLDRGSVPSARLSYRVGGAWLLSAEAGAGYARYSYVDSSRSANGAMYTVARWRGEAQRSFVGIAIGREVFTFKEALSLWAELGYAVHHLTVGEQKMSCPPPSIGVGPPMFCRRSEPWERTYTLRKVETGLGLGYQVARHLGVQVRAQYAVGSTSTREGFWVPMRPPFTHLEAPTSQWIRTGRLSAGLSVWP